MRHLTASFGVSERRACRVVGVARSSHQYRPTRPADEGRLADAILAVVRRHPRFGYRRVWAVLRADGWRVNRKRVYRAWRRLGLRVTEVLDRLFAERGVPAHVRSDNGPEFIAGAVRGWLAGRAVEVLYVAPASPWENGFAEAFHGKVRDEFLAAEEFGSLREAAVLGAEWRRAYNHDRPHSSLGYQTPAAFGATCPRFDATSPAHTSDTMGTV